MGDLNCDDADAYGNWHDKMGLSDGIKTPKLNKKMQRT